MIKLTLHDNLLGVRCVAVLVPGQALVLARVLRGRSTYNQSLVILHDLNAADRVGQLLVVKVPGDVRGRVSIHLALDVNLGSNSDLLAISQVQSSGNRH